MARESGTTSFITKTRVTRLPWDEPNAGKSQTTNQALEVYLLAHSGQSSTTMGRCPGDRPRWRDRGDAVVADGLKGGAELLLTELIESRP